MIPGAEWVWTDNSAINIGDRGHWSESSASAGTQQVLDRRTCYVCEEEFDIYNNETRVRLGMCDSDACVASHRNNDEQTIDDKANTPSVP